MRDHGGGVDAAAARFGGARGHWIDLSTGINPVPYPVGDLPLEVWTALPDAAAMAAVLEAARRFWNVPEGAEIIAAPGASALIAAMPVLAGPGDVHVPGPTYNEHAAAFRAHGRVVRDDDPAAPVHVYVHPNNPDGRRWPASVIGGRTLTVIDESFCDVVPGQSHVARAAAPGVVVLKSFGKFWGLAGLRLGFAIGRRDTLAPDRVAGLADLLGPWPVSGAALQIGARALRDAAWAQATRDRLADDADRLDRMVTQAGAEVMGGTTLFRLYDIPDAERWQDHLARHRIWTRRFPYNPRWLRLGLPGPGDWDRLQAALEGVA